MKVWFLCSIHFFIASFMYAQTLISGTVKDNKNKPLRDVSITLVNTYDGATTDSLGNFLIKTFEMGNQKIKVSRISYKTEQKDIQLTPQKLIINFILKEEITELTAVTVTAGSFEAGDKKKAATVLSALDIYTTGGANGDISSALKTLPGAQQIGEQEGLFVRGGTGSETKQMIDGMVISSPYFTGPPDIATRGRFSPSLFKGNIFSTGGYSALYGQALSSVLLMESIDMPQRSEGLFSISSVFAGFGFQNLAKNKKSSIGFNYGYTNLTLYFSLIPQKIDYFKMPIYHTADANYRWKTKKGGMLKYFTTFSQSSFGLRNINIDSLELKDAFALKSLNWYNNINFRENIGKGWKLFAGLGYTLNQDRYTSAIVNKNNEPTQTNLAYIDSKNYSLFNNQHFGQARLTLEKKMQAISAFRIGSEYWHTNYTTQYNPYAPARVTDNYTAVFSEIDFYLTNQWAFKVGVREEYSSILNKFNFAPRASVGYKLNKTAQISASYGIFYQNPDWQLWATAMANRLQHIGYAKASHYLINYISNTEGRTFRMEAYYKLYHNLLKTFPDTSMLGNGYARGFELFWRDRKTFKNIDYWISYSYLDTKRQFLNYPYLLRPTFASPHTFSLVTKTFIQKIKLGFNITYSYALGRPYFNIVYNPATQQNEITQSGITQPYNTIGLSANYLPNLGKPKAKLFYVIVASINNLLNNDLVYGYRYPNSNSYKTAITPPAKQVVFLGCFLSWGTDRTQEAINNNL